MRQLTEGKAAIHVPRQRVDRTAEAFYNPAMEYHRDITMSALRVFSRELGRGISVCDPLAGTGVRSVRMALEVPAIARITANDMSTKAFRIMKMNIEENGINAEMLNKNANELFLEHPRAFDFIDIDPFGSPVNYIHNAAYALKPKSVLAVTATDTGALCGSFPSTCFARYGIRNWKTDFYKETGARVLATSVMMQLARHDMAFEPLYAHANHYFRVIGHVRRSKSAVTKQAKSICFVSYCQKCLYRETGLKDKCPECGGGLKHMGPVWTGSMIDRGFAGKMLEDLRRSGYKNTKELWTALSEIDEPFYYDMHRMFKVLGKTPKKTNECIRGLEAAGFKASRTHFSGTGLKTNAPYRELIKRL